MKRAGIRRQNAARNHALLELALADKDLSSTAKCVLTVLLFKFQNGASGLCNPSFDSIAEAVACSRRHAISAVKELKDQKWLTYESTKGGSARNTNRFAFDFGRLPVKKRSPHRSEETFTGEENDARGEESFPRTTEEPLSPSGSGCSSNTNRSARARSPSGSRPRPGGWQGPKSVRDDDGIKDLGASYGVGRAQ